MVTGDNINTAIAISKDVGIIDPSQVAQYKEIAKKYRSEAEKKIQIMPQLQLEI